MKSKIFTLTVAIWASLLLAGAAAAQVPGSVQAEAGDQVQGDPVQCAADALIDQPLGDLDNARTSDAQAGFLIADNFTTGGIATTVDTGSLDNVTVWGVQLEFDPASGFVGPCGNDAADFVVTSWTDSGGAPETPIDDQMVSPTITDTGIVFALGATVFRADLELTGGLDIDDAGWLSVQREASPDTGAGNQCFFLWNDTIDTEVGDNSSLQIDLADSSVTTNGSDQTLCAEGTGDLIEPDLEPTDVAGFTFAGDVTGISGSAAWAADMRLDVEGPADATAVGGFDDPGPLVWDFDGGGSTEDGSYASDHSNAFAPGTTPDGDWTLTFANDWGASPIDQCWTNTVVTLVRNDGSEIAIPIPDDCYAAGESQVVVETVGGPPEPPPEARKVPVNNLWALGFLALLIAGFGTLMIRRMA
jgi:hypothetical protein